MTMICWRCHNKSVNTGSRLLISNIKTRKRPNMIGIDMIRNKRIKKIFLSVIIINYVIIFINFYESSFCWALNFPRNFLIFIESKLRKIHIINEEKTSCEDKFEHFLSTVPFLSFLFPQQLFLMSYFLPPLTIVLFWSDQSVIKKIFMLNQCWNLFVWLVN